MKWFIIVPILALVGAGCSTSSTVLTQNQPTVSNQTSQTQAANQMVNQANATPASYTNSIFHYSVNYPVGWTIDKIGFNPELEGIIQFSSPFDSNTTESIKVQISAVQGYSAASTEQSLQQEGIQFTKNQMQIGGVISTRFIYSSSKLLWNKTYSERNITVYVPGKGQNGTELSINGHCSTFAVPNPSPNCSTTVDTVMDTIVLPSITFTGN